MIEMSYIKKISVTIFLLLAFFVTLGGQAMADDKKARAIMEKMDARDDGDNMISDMEMTLIDKNGSERKRNIRFFSKDIGEDSYKLMFFLSPADVKNTGFLTYDYDDEEKDDDQWLYLPALKKTKRIASSDKSGSFMGSDFNYSDMSSKNLTDYDFKLLKEAEVRGEKVWVIESTPRNQDVIEETGYTKSIVLIRQDNFVVVRAVHWEKDGSKRKYLDVKQLELIDGIWTSLEITMTTKRGKSITHKTVLKNSNVKYNQKLEETLFTIRRLEKGM